ncbi:DUF6773 family protein [Salisediminibacterium halotolerans]|uniref:DUF6773 family protein n=1 Tax=Salisediminibacterium halotolerans TaxID=517425 RepID=UPI000EADD173|nr:DUF6773 family protein [Salisediminibacterium halotolerans]RLJ78254.1 hypothetical protein BCL39_0725 [Actinophytocola xinjiangensis]RPE88407.1 hypothetical protein EDD67_0734 [Salisediminibacterium halotolerans]TWG37231.1 hypothetical protein BCL52_0724 [Salisediminibacterium halotolerans]GEL07165.1 hypothetical protein SHA02_05810 [Salisediminibacterium halotolerans]
MSFLKKLFKNDLDERLKADLRKVQSEGFNLMFFGLLAILFVRIVIQGHAGAAYQEFFLLFILAAFYVVVRMISKGIVDKADEDRGARRKKNLFVAVFSAGLFILFQWLSGGIESFLHLAVQLLSFLFFFYLILTLMQHFSLRQANKQIEE